MELLIVAGNQVTKAPTIIGNSAPKSRAGFMVQCVDAKKHLYGLMIGSGKTPTPLLQFRIIPHEPCHIVISKNKNRWTAYVNGSRAAQTESPITYLDSPRSLFLGSWYSRNYRFTGKVREVRFFDAALTDREVSRLYMRIAKEVV